LKGVVFDVRTKKHIRTIRRWSGQVTKDGRLGLYAPSRGGLELVNKLFSYQFWSFNLKKIKIKIF
jgi:hypothetical protein